MCDFHSTCWRELGQDIQVTHVISNSHSEAIIKAGWRDNEPNRKTVNFEAEWDGEGEMPENNNLIRNFEECSEKLANRIREHYIKLSEAITTGKWLDSYFKDIDTWRDVWAKAIEKGVFVKLPEVWEGGLTITKNTKVDVSNLTKVSKHLYLYEGAQLTAEKLTEVGGYLCLYKEAQLTAEKLTKIGGSLNLYEEARLNAPKLK